ncbi:MAG: VPLPA-CTERM sorting domain-containing protein [Methylococcales bacterium]|nr:VPLPA-CTERM sorting domain-containing protein [Methylococcales bacterium]
MNQKIILAILLLTMSNAYAAVVYTQAPIAGSGYDSAYINLSTDPGFNGNSDADQQVWATFSVAANTTFNEIIWYGNQTDINFAVDLHYTAANCPSCGLVNVGTSGSYTTANVASELMPTSGAYTSSQVQQALISPGLYSYTLDLPTAVTLTSANLYVLSVVNNYSPGNPFIWANSTTGNGTSMDFVVGRASFLTMPGYFAFTLANTAVAVVPLPAAYWLFLSGVIGFYGVIRKSKKA